MKKIVVYISFIVLFVFVGKFVRSRHKLTSVESPSIVSAPFLVEKTLFKQIEDNAPIQKSIGSPSAPIVMLDKKCDTSRATIMVSPDHRSLSHYTPSAAIEERLNYFGIDVMYGKNGYQDNFGANILHDNWAIGANVFIGHYFNNSLGLELGYQRFSNKFRESEIQFDTPQFGINNFSGFSDDIYNSKTSMYNVNLNLSAKFNLHKNVSIVPFIGVAYATAKIDMNVLSRDGMPSTDSDKNLLNFNGRKSKLIPRAGIRVEYLFTKNFGGRLSYVWENTSAIELKITRENIVPRTAITAKLKNTSIYSLGIFYKLD